MNGSSMWEAVSGIIRRDLLLAMRRRSDAAMSVFFLCDRGQPLSLGCWA